ncbi:MAG: MTH1187 family thiamine-binding protein [Candidatus Odinarchaeota archaeon]
MRVILEFSTAPVGLGVSLSTYVKKAIDTVKQSGMKYQVTPMGTVLEGDSLQELLEVVMRAHESIFEAGAARVVTSVKIDERRDVERVMEDKIRKVV